VDIEQAIRDVEGITGEPIRKKRGRKPKDPSQKTEGKQAPVPGFDAKEFENTLSGIYWQFVSVLARVSVIPKPEQEEKAKPLLVYCANKYIPAGASEHVPLIALCMITLDIAKTARAEFLEASEMNGGKKRA
jgi:hypothetical protein